ncbi:MAG: hypothetical protein K8R59_05345 [Thermoanaerobaculales bacterium]|nr:hypothetical protein [Thermoanaerobaculales bacterium]
MEGANRIIQLENNLRELITRWERYFGGDLKLPPLREKEILSRRLRLLSEHGPQRSADRFRLDQLQHRFMTYAMNWERMLREREEGIRRFVPGRKPTKEPVAVGEKQNPANTLPGRSVDESGAEALFVRWKEAKEKIGEEVRVDQKTFGTQIDDQRRQLEEKIGRPVEFDVKVEDGKVKLTARRIDRANSEEK